MQKSDRSIVGAVVQKGKTYVSGQEAELAEVLDQDNIDRLVGKGTLAGDWSGASSFVQPAAEDADSGSGDGESTKPAKPAKGAKAPKAPKAAKPAKPAKGA